MRLIVYTRSRVFVLSPNVPFFFATTLQLLLGTPQAHLPWIIVPAHVLVILAEARLYGVRRPSEGRAQATHRGVPVLPAPHMRHSTAAASCQGAIARALDANQGQRVKVALNLQAVELTAPARPTATEVPHDALLQALEGGTLAA